jgi:hypothetical protein
MDSDESGESARMSSVAHKVKSDMIDEGCIMIWIMPSVYSARCHFLISYFMGMFTCSGTPASVSSTIGRDAASITLSGLCLDNGRQQKS